MRKDGQLLFYPTKATVNDFDITAISYNLNDTYLGIGSTALSDVAIINTSSVNVPSGTTTNVVGIASTYRSLRVLVEITPDLDFLSVIVSSATFDVLVTSFLFSDACSVF